MKKIFSFFVALMATTVMASAMEIAVPATTLDLQEPTMVTDAGWAGEVAYYLDDDVLVTSGQESRLSFENQTWITKLNTGSSNNTWDALAPFKGSEFYSNKAYATLQAGRYTAYLVTGCDSVWVYGYNNANTGKYLIMDVYEIAGEVATINTDETAATYSVNDEAAGKANVVLKQALDATKKYLVVTTGAGASNSRVFEIAFFRHSDVSKTYWTVAGSSEVAFGTAWAPANKANDMVKQEDGSYKWEKTELELAAGEIAFKVCKDHAWTEAYPASDYKLSIDAAGIYTITITFEPENENKVSAVATKTGEAVVLPTVVLHGNFFGDWKDTDPFAPAEDKLTARLNLTLAEGNYEFGFKFDGAWKANGANITREAPTTSLAEGSGNMHFAADAAGEYQLTYTFESQTLEVVYPKKPEVLPEGAFKLTFNGTGEAGKDASAAYGTEVEAIFDAASALYVASVETATKVYAGRPIADDNSSLKFGTSSAAGTLAFTLATPVEVDSIIVNATQYGDKAAEVTVNGVKFGLTDGNKVPTDCKLVANGEISQITIEQTGSERIYLRYVTVYAKTSPTPPTPPTPVTLPVVALAGGMNGWSADANILVAAEDSLSASVKVALEAGDVEFKIVSDGKWLSLNGEDPDGLYTFHRDWTTVSHVNVIDGRNFKLTADVAGDYIFTWTYADSTLAITFPAKEDPVVVELQAVSAATTWDFSKITANTGNALYNKEGIQLTDESTPSKNDEMVYANYSADFMTFAEGFDATTMAFKGEYPIRKNQYCQAGTLHFKTTVAGKITVKFSDTGTSASATAVKRYLVVNGEQTEYWTSRENNGEEPYAAQLNVTSDEIAVPAGDVTITGSSAIVVYNVTFTPSEEPIDPEVNYYLVGSVKGWEAKAENIFTLNAEAGEGIEEYVIETTLEVNEGLKVLSSTGTWYPEGMGNEYIVDQNHAGTTTIYFRPAGNEEWAAFGGYMYVVPTSTTGIEEILSEGKAVKIVREGNLIILKGDKAYNAMGQIVK